MATASWILAVFTAQFESTKPAGQQRFVQIVRVLGDGDGNFGSPAVLASIAVTIAEHNSSQEPARGGHRWRRRYGMWWPLKKRPPD